MNNLYALEFKGSDEELFYNILSTENIHIEKIVSYGQITPVDSPYIQNHNEWVMVLDGKAKLKLDNDEYTLNKGEYLYIPKSVKHWVTYTSDPTIWLAVHIKD